MPSAAIIPWRALDGWWCARADSNNNLYFLTGNGAFDADSGGSDYGDQHRQAECFRQSPCNRLFPRRTIKVRSSRAAIWTMAGRSCHSRRPASGPVQHPTHRWRQIRCSSSLPSIATIWVITTQEATTSSTSLSIGKEILANRRFSGIIPLHRWREDSVGQYTFNTGTGQFSSSLTHSSACCYYNPGSTPVGFFFTGVVNKWHRLGAR